MEKDSLSSLYDIQLFAEAGESAGTGGAGSPAGQESAALAQPQQKGVNHPGSQANAGRGAAPDAGEQQDDDTRRAARFEALIKGEYKDLYDQRVQDTIRKSAGPEQGHRGGERPGKAGGESGGSAGARRTAAAGEGPAAAGRLAAPGGGDQSALPQL